jgi:hypothetical protein
MAADYTAYPTVDDVQLLLDSCAVTLRLDAPDAAARIERVIGDVTTEVERDTLRQFIAGEDDEARSFDGSGTPEMEVDELVALVGVTVIGVTSDPGYTLAPVLVSEQGRPRTRLVLGRGSLPAWQTAGVMIPSQNVFPAGRQNIVVTGTFGYGATVPVDLWESLCGEMALRLCQEVSWRPIGPVTQLKIGESSTTYKPSLPWATGWHDRYRQALKRYRRPSGRRLRLLGPQ